MASNTKIQRVQREKESNGGFNKNRLGIFVLSILLLALIVYAASPTLPTTLWPGNNSVVLSVPTLSCNGSTDADSDAINIEFYHLNYENVNPRFRVAGVTNASWYWHINFSAGEPDGDAYMAIDDGAISNEGDWLDADAAGQNFLCERGEGESYYQNATGGAITWTQAKASCENINGSEGWHMAVVQSSDENDLLANLCTGGVYCYIGGKGDPSPTTWYWAYNQTTNFTLQNTSSTTYSWSGLELGTENWTCRACDVNNDCSDYLGNMAVSYVNFSQCLSSELNKKVINFTIWDEENRTTQQLVAKWDYVLTVSNAWDTLLVTGSTNINDSNLTFCLDDSDLNTTTVYLDDAVEYLPDNGSYSFPRQYYFDNASITAGTLTNIPVYSLPDGLSTAVTFTVTEEGITPVPNAIIHLQRYDPGTGTSSLVAMGKTSTLGKDIIYLRLTDAWYTILLYDSTGTLRYSSGPEHILTTTYNINIGITIGGYSTMSDWGLYDSIVWNLNFSNTSNVTSLIADDSTGYVTNMCLQIDRFDFSGYGRSEYCVSCVASSSITTWCELNETGYYLAKFVAYHDGDWRLIDSLDVNLGKALDEFIGLDGPFLALLIIGMMFFIGLYSPTASIILGIFGMIFSVALGLLTIAWSSIIGIIFVGLLLLFRKKGT